MNQLESALRTLATDPWPEPAPAGLADRALTRSRQRTRRRGALAVAGAAAVAALLAVGVTTTVADQQRRATPAPAATSLFAEPQVNVLVIGSDAAPDRVGVRPDTLILAGIDTTTGDTTLIGIPRSLERVPFPPGTPQAAAWPDGFTCQRSACLLNSLWTWAEGDGARYYPGDANPGLTATTEAIEQISGLEVDDTVVVDMRGLVALVDAVGGVDVRVRERLPIGGNANDRRATGGWLEKGRQHLDGETALWFARSRWNTDNADRMARQQCLLAALARQVDEKALLTAYPAIAKALGDDVRTTIGPQDLARLAQLLAGNRDARITRVDLIIDNNDPDFPAVRRLVRDSLAPSAADGKGPAGRRTSAAC